MKENLNDVRLSPHFLLREFLNLGRYPENNPTMQAVANLTYGCHLLLEPARFIVGSIIITSGFRCEAAHGPGLAPRFLVALPPAPPPDPHRLLQVMSTR